MDTFLWKQNKKRALDWPLECHLSTLYICKQKKGVIIYYIELKKKSTRNINTKRWIFLDPLQNSPRNVLYIISPHNVSNFPPNSTKVWRYLEENHIHILRETAYKIFRGLKYKVAYRFFLLFLEKWTKLTVLQKTKKTWDRIKN